MIYAAVFLLSLASLAYEVLLPRIFAFTQWHHLAFLVISVAVFGFGAGGALVSLAEARRLEAASKLADPARAAGLGLLCLLFCLSAAGSLLFLLSVPLDYFRLPVEPRQAGYLALSWLLLLLPFLLAGAVQALAFAALPGRSGWLYAAGMVGGACGALLPPVLLGRVREVSLALGCLVLPALPWVLLPLQPAVPRRSAWLLACAALVAAAAPLWWPPAAGRWWPAAARLRPSPYKLLAQAGQLAGTRHLGTENGPAGRVDWLDSPALRFVPGLSLAYPGGLPQPLQAVIDGDALLQLFPLQEPSRLAFCGYTTAYAAYALREDWAGARALLLLESGGLTLPCAVLAGAGSITVVLRQPAVARRLRDLAPGLRVLTGNPRAVLAGSAAGFGEGFDLVQLESWGSSAPGAASLEQDHLLTTGALAACLRRLRPDGLFSVSRRIQLPPSDSLRLLGATFEALRGLGVQEPGRNIAMLRSWDTYTLIAGRQPFGPGELGRLARFCEERSFDLLFLEGLREEEANRFVQLRAAVPLPGAAAPGRRAGGRPGGLGRPGGRSGLGGRLLPRLPSGRAPGHGRKALPEPLPETRARGTVVPGHRQPALFPPAVRGGGAAGHPGPFPGHRPAAAAGSQPAGASRAGILPGLRRRVHVGGDGGDPGSHLPVRRTGHGRGRGVGLAAGLFRRGGGRFRALAGARPAAGAGGPARGPGRSAGPAPAGAGCRAGAGPRLAPGRRGAGAGPGGLPDGDPAAGGAARAGWRRPVARPGLGSQWHRRGPGFRC